MSNIPEIIRLIECPECGFKRTTEDPKVTRIRVGGENCPDCGHRYGLEAVVAAYELTDFDEKGENQ